MPIIAHLDMDAFFAAVEERDNPQFAGLPIVVGADPKEGSGRGVVSTANYQARKYGIRSAMPITQAWRLAPPETVWLSGHWQKYSRASQRVFAALAPFVHLRCVHQVGVDEAYLDLSSLRTYQAAAKLARKIKQEIEAKERLTCSIGIGPNKLIAKIASDFDKPDGLVVVKPKDVAQFLAPLSIRAIPGVGPVTERNLNARGIRTIADLHQLTREEIGSLYDKARGVGSYTFPPPAPAKSISEQHTFPQDTSDAVLLANTLQKISARLTNRLWKEQSRITIYRTITVTVRFGDFETHNHSHTLKQPTNSLKILKHESLKLFLPFLDRRKNPAHKKIRLLGLRIEKFI